MPGNSQPTGRGARRPSAVPAGGSGGKNREGLKGRGRTLPADERPWHKAYSGDEPLPRRTAWKQEKEKRAAEAEGRAPKVGQPGSKSTGGRTGAGATGRTRGAMRTTRVAPGRRSAPASARPVGPAHYTLWRSNYGKPPGSGALDSGGAVPEPTTGLLILCGIAGLPAARARRRLAK